MNSTHDLGRFDCGNGALNTWLKSNALESEGQSARTYVACESNVVVGYYCIATGSVERRALPSKLKRQQGLPKMPNSRWPSSAAWRAISPTEAQAWALICCKTPCEESSPASEIIGVRCVLVHAIDDNAAKFWKDNEFIEYPDGSRAFFMPVEKIIGAL